MGHLYILVLVVQNRRTHWTFSLPRHESLYQVYVSGAHVVCSSYGHAFFLALAYIIITIKDLLKLNYFCRNRFFTKILKA